MNKTIFLTLFLTIGCLPQKENKPLQVTQSKIVHGAPLETKHEGLSFTVALFSLHGSSCTGVVISKRAILTAAHCLEGDTPSTLIVSVGDLVPSNTIIYPKELFIHPDYTSRPNAQVDLGIIITREDLPSELKPMPLVTKFLDESYFVLESFGYSPLTLASRKDMIDHFEGVNSNASFDEDLLKDQKLALNGKLLGGLYLENQNRQIALTQYAGGICSGDSGGPTTISLNGNRVIMGINTSVTSNIKGEVDCTNFGFITPVALHMEWISYILTNEGQTYSTVEMNEDDKVVADDVNCIKNYLLSFKHLGESYQKNKDICVDAKVLEKDLKTYIASSKAHCTSPLAKFYPTYLQNTLYKLKTRCNLK